jgi:hypothetical protein
VILFPVMRNNLFKKITLSVGIFIAVCSGAGLLIEDQFCESDTWEAYKNANSSIVSVSDPNGCFDYSVMDYIAPCDKDIVMKSEGVIIGDYACKASEYMQQSILAPVYFVALLFRS